MIFKELISERFTSYRKIGNLSACAHALHQILILGWRQWLVGRL